MRMKIKYPGIVLLVVLLMIGMTWISQAGESVSVKEMMKTDLTLEFDTDQEMARPGMVDYQTWFGGGTTVHFDHALHTEEKNSCTMCHHTEACGVCHGEQEYTVPVRNSRIAFHEACFQCHEQESDGAGCIDCHESASAGTGSGGVKDSDALGYEGQYQLIEAIENFLPRMNMLSENRHIDREKPLPTTVEYLTDYEGTTMVVFSHKDHVDEYEMSCGACHHVQNCTVCHVGLRRVLTPDTNQDAAHASCQGCHEEIGAPAECDECHQRIEAR